MSIAVESFWPSRQLTDKFESIYPWNGPGSDRDPLEILRSKASEPLVDKDFNHGIVYVYSVDGNPSLIKIGYTGRSLQIRQAEIEFGCNRKCKILHYGKVPNAKQVEELCHADLHEDRVQIYCSGCLGNHNEWFNITEEKARAVLDKWATWIESIPYETRSLRIDEKGYLKDASKLRNMAAFKKDPMV